MEPSVAQAKVMVDELIRCGVTDVVLSPGSRSAPLALELAAAHARFEIRVHVRLEERVAGFVALGIGKATGIPAAVVTTSGSAVANLLPAVIEADHSYVPMLLLTADRPPQLRGIGANQTIAQTTIFGPHVRSVTDLATATTSEGQVKYWRSEVSRAVGIATDSISPGPVHLNIPFSAPLVGDPDGNWVEDLDGRPDGRPWVADARLFAAVSSPLDEIMTFLDEEGVVPARGLIVVGDHNDSDFVEMIDELSDFIGWPIIAEPSANLSRADLTLSHGLLLAADEAFRETHIPELVLTIGKVGLSRGVLQLIDSAEIHIAVDSHVHFCDPTRSADLVIASVPLPPQECEVDGEWLEQWQRADILAAAAIETVLNPEELTGMQIARVVTRFLPESGTLFLGASSAVRHVASFAATGVTDSAVLGNRGVSGIDGCISTASGIAISATVEGDGCVVALVGDQSFLYDSNALLIPPTETSINLVIVVIDNNGGGIFSTLEQGAPEYSKHFEQVFGVPLDVDPALVASSMKANAVTVTNEDDLAEVLDRAINGGLHVITATSVDRAREGEILGHIAQAVREALSGS
jgi:2-succinyl-5-enolpyruvyl-6-hydroxy-3-cyclohexene-1-carboxylate synthase